MKWFKHFLCLFENVSLHKYFELERQFKLMNLALKELYTPEIMQGMIWDKSPVYDLIKIKGE